MTRSLQPQYAALEKLYRDKKDRGLEVLGFPANDFAGQEPGTEAEIAEFCRLNYDVTFPMFSKIAVTGPATHALYRELTSAQPRAQGDPDGFPVVMHKADERDDSERAGHH